MGAIRDITEPSSRHVLNEPEMLRSIAHELLVPPGEIEDLFTLVVQRYYHECTIRDYLPVMIPRRVKELYRKRIASRTDDELLSP